MKYICRSGNHICREGLLSLLYKSLLWGRLEQVVELQPGSHHFLFVRIVSSVLRSFPPRHVEEYDQSNQSHEEHPSSHGGNDQTGPLLIKVGREGFGNVKNLERETVSNGMMKDRVQLERDVLVLIELSRVKQVMRDIPRTLCNSVQYNIYIFRGSRRVMPAPYLLHSCSAYRLDQSFFRWNFQHVVKLEAGRGELLLGGPVVPLPLPLPAGHHKEDKQTDKCYESHTAHYWSDYEGELFCL